jgi:hypothetical protein
MLLLAILLMNGSEAHINANEIVAMIEARPADDPLKRYVPDARCIVITTDGKEYTTREECARIEGRLHALLDKQGRKRGQ